MTRIARSLASYWTLLRCAFERSRPLGGPERNREASDSPWLSTYTFHSIRNIERPLPLLG